MNYIIKELANMVANIALSLCAYVKWTCNRAEQRIYRTATGSKRHCGMV